MSRHKPLTPLTWASVMRLRVTMRKSVKLDLNTKLIKKKNGGSQKIDTDSKIFCRALRVSILLYSWRQRNNYFNLTNITNIVKNSKKIKWYSRERLLFMWKYKNKNAYHQTSFLNIKQTTPSPFTATNAAVASDWAPF